jgi:hypothetical protein
MRLDPVDKIVRKALGSLGHGADSIPTQRDTGAPLIAKRRQVLPPMREKSHIRPTEVLLTSAQPSSRRFSSGPGR